MKKTFILLFLGLFTGKIALAQNVGMSCQYFPGAQVGRVSVKTSHYGKYAYGAGLPLLMIDRVSNHWYTNMDFSALYYGATQTNKANDNQLKISKAEGAVSAFRLGYLWGEGDQFRMGGNLNFGWNTSNLDSLIKPMDHMLRNKRVYLNYGLGVIAYKKFGKFRAVGKVGYELYRRKGLLNGGSGFYFEGTVGYSFYQKYGISVMPCFYSKSLTYTPLTKSGGTVLPEDKAKVRAFVLRVGITKFF
ncbi:MAG: hypothetical protein IT236_00110 [Bacteroidia bacterium]|nr:hypothetical protein [Bacteroidia bacterium]